MPEMLVRVRTIESYDVVLCCNVLRVVLQRSDMKSLTEEGIGSSLNLQQRVISSGLESMTGGDAPKVITLFKGMAVYAE